MPNWSSKKRIILILSLSFFANVIFGFSLLYRNKNIISVAQAQPELYRGSIGAIRDFVRENPNAREVVLKAKDRAEAEQNGYLNVKKFSMVGAGDRYFFYPSHINYVDKNTGEVIEADPNFVLQFNGTFLMNKASYEVQAPAFSDEALTFTIDDESISFTAVSVGTTTTRHIAGVLQGSRVVYADAFGDGIDYVLQAEPDELRKLVVFRNPIEPQADIRIVFQTSLAGAALIHGRNTEIGKVFFRQPDVWDFGGIREPISVELRGRQLIKIIPKTFFARTDGAVLQYPVATDTTTSYYSGPGDGTVAYLNATAGWATAHDATSGTTVDYTSANLNIGVYADSGGFDIMRGFFPTNTSLIEDTDYVAAGILYIYINGKLNGENDGNDYLGMYSTNQADTLSLVAADYDNISTTSGGDTPDFSVISTAAYLGMNINATGLSWVSKTGFSYFGVREGHDAVNDPCSCSTTGNTLAMSHSEDTGTSRDPYLSLTTATASISSVSTDKSVYSTSTEGVRITSTQTTNDTISSTTIEYVIFLDNDQDNTLDTGERFITDNCTSWSTWAGSGYSKITSGFTETAAQSPKTNTVECPNTNFPENGKYSVYVKWHDGVTTIDTDTSADFESCDQPISNNSWWDTSFENRSIITFKNSTITEALHSFPVMVKASSTLQILDDIESSGDDVRFIDDDGTTMLDFEKEYIDATTTKEAYWWVEVTKIATSTSCDYMFIYYDNTSTTSVATTTGVWRQDYYEAVWHFGETATGTTYNFQEGVSPNSSYTGADGVMIGDGSPTTNLFNKTAFQVDYLTTVCGGTNKICRTLQQWDISTISSCTVSSASITINVSNGTADLYGVYALRRNWTQNGATWNTYDGTNSWTTAGAGDATNDYYSTDLMNGNSDSGWGRNSTGSITHDFDSDGVSTIQDWINGTVTNNGIIIRDHDSTDDDGYAWATTTDATTANRPKLTINCGTVDTYLDSTVNNHDETNSSLASRKEWSESIIGYSPKFDGSSSVIGIPDSAGFDLNNYTITGWFQREGTGDALPTGTGAEAFSLVPFTTKGYAEADSQTQDIHWAVGYSSVGQATLAADFEDTRRDGTNNNNLLGSTSLTNDLWYQFAYRVATGSLAVLYLNGFSDSTTTRSLTSGPNVGGTQKVGIGTGYNTAGTSDGKWLGYLDELRIMKVAISTTTNDNNSSWLKADWLSGSNSYISWGTEATTSAGALSITASSTVLAFPSVDYYFIRQTSTATNVGGVQVVGVGSWTLNVSCADNAMDCTWKGQTENDRFKLHIGTGSNDTGQPVSNKNTGIFCYNWTDISCTSTSGDTCSTVTNGTGYNCYNSAKTDVTMATGSSADGTFWFAETDWQVGIPGSVSASIYTTTITYDLF